MRLFYRQVGASLDTTGPTMVGNGALTVSSLVANGQYVAFVVADNGSAYSPPSYAYVSLAQQGDLLSAAVQARFASYPALVAVLPGGLWTGEVPEGTSPAYGWLDVGPINPTPTTEDRFDRARFTAHLYAVGANAAEACALQWQSVFDWQALTFATASSVWVVPRSYRLIPEPVRYKDGTLMFRAFMAYECLAQRARS